VNRERQRTVRTAATPMVLALTSALLLALPSTLHAQGPALGQATEVPEAPKPLEDFEVDTDSDGIPDGWYNLRDAKAVEGGIGPAKSKCFRFENDKPGRPARASRAFGVDGRQVEAVVVGLWIRQESIVSGERLGDDPSLIIDFLSDPHQLKAVRRGLLGPWKSVGPAWTHVAKRLPIPPDTRLAILSVGLIGATGVLEVDNLTIELIPVGGRPTSNLALNGDFELGDPDPTHWQVDHGARRVSPGNRSASAIELKGNGARAFTGLGLPVEGIGTLEVSVVARASGLRGAAGAVAMFFFLDEDGRPLPGLEGGVPALSFTGSFPWQPSRATVQVPRGAVRALIQFEKGSAYGTLWIDDVEVVANGGQPWTPDHVETGSAGWFPVAPSPSIVEKSALDASALLDAPAGKHGFVTVKDGRLAFGRGGRARFFGVTLLAPTAFPPDKARAIELADRLARSGVNLVRLGDLDTPLGPGRSLFDDSRDDTRELDPEALGRLDRLIAALKERGVYVAVELQGARRFRDGDTSIPNARRLPPGGGAAAAFDPSVREAARKAAEGLLSHVNLETGLALKDDPVLAWVTLAGELSLFDLVDAAEKESGTEAAEIRDLMRKDDIPNARRGWQAVESEQWRTLADQLRKIGVKVPIAGGSNWRRDHDYAAAQAAPGLDLIDDRIYYNPPSWTGPDRRSLLLSKAGGLLADASKKRKLDRPYVVGQWAMATFGAWATPYEGADLLLASLAASHEDWDALVRRGVFMFPRAWGSNAAGTGGGEDIFALAEAINGIPQIFALLPHASSILLRPVESKPAHRPTTPRTGKNATKPGLAGWDPGQGRLVVDTPHTHAVAGWVGEWGANFEGLKIDVDAGPFGVVAVSSLGPDPIATGKRLLVTVIGRVEPTGFRWVDEWKRSPGDPGRPPLLQEPVKARVAWKRSGEVKAYALDNTGARVGPAPLEKVEGGYRLTIDGRSPGIHWELATEERPRAPTDRGSN
jgi:hypothetical protein